MEREREGMGRGTMCNVPDRGGVSNSWATVLPRSPAAASACAAPSLANPSATRGTRCGVRTCAGFSC